MTSTALLQRGGSAHSVGYVEEHTNGFFRLFPHRFDYLVAAHRPPGTKPDWQTESRHPLSDRLIEEGQSLYGVRFGKATAYAMLDIDAESAYHPDQDPLAIGRITGVLEDRLGLVAYVAVRSSYSGGLHLYFPFTTRLRSWQVGGAITGILEQAGFSISGGVLEVFPNRRPFTSDGDLALFNGHRLPLQAGSYLLNADFEPIHGGQARFVTAWEWAKGRNVLTAKVLKQALKTLRQTYPVSRKAAKFLGDLDTEIVRGWTGAHQTNRLIGRIAMRTYVFAPVLYGASLVGRDLVTKIAEVAKNLPGFKQFCGHQQDFLKRVKAWARSVEASGRYYPYRSTKLKTDKSDQAKAQPSWNDRQRHAARNRISAAIAKLIDADAWPDEATARAIALRTKTGCSLTTLYKHKELWHPAATFDERADEKAGEGAISSAPATNLLGDEGWNSPSGKASETVQQPEKGGQGVRDAEAVENLSPQGFDLASPQQMIQKQGPGFIQGILATIKRRSAQAAQQRTHALAVKQGRQHQLAFEEHQRHRQRMIQWLDSGDPILMAEAEMWLCRHGFEP